ncbi:MAG: chemotaxis protein CheW [Alphaproteobacteria bacterium]|nr:chemotaxis protein CheW [Alphaproteobacteria bacterium]MCD8570184.1 chemotaxis protein CheW [Alphaproteobacteria bacterium]
MTQWHEDMEAADEYRKRSSDFLTIQIGDQMFGIPVLQVQDVLGKQKVTKIPLAPPEVAGSLNLRGRIVTAINVRKRLGLPENDNKSSQEMSVVVEHESELYSLIIDKVGDVLSLSDDTFEKNPSTLDPLWREVSSGIYRLKDKLLIVMDVPKFLGSVNA